MSNVASVYAKALFDLAKENNDLENTYQQVQIVKEIINVDLNLLSVLKSIHVEKSEKKEIVNNIFKKYLNNDMNNFLKLLIDKNRIGYILDICKEYKKIYLESINTKEAIIYSTIDLSENQIQEIKLELEKQYDCLFIIENKIDSNLIAGIKITIGDYVIDGSLNNKLKSLKEQILLKSL